MTREYEEPYRWCEHCEVEAEYRRCRWCRGPTIESKPVEDETEEQAYRIDAARDRITENEINQSQGAERG